jgi:hypothetical protein
MCRSRRTVAAVPTSAFWWQWPWNRIRRPLRSEPSRSRRPPSSIASASSSSTSRVAPATAKVAGSSGRSATCSSRRVSRQLGSTPTIGTPRSANGASRADIVAASSPAWSSSPLEMLARPQQASSSTRTRQPAASSSSIAAIGMAGSVHVVNESARNTTSPRVKGPSGGWRAASQRTRWSRWKRGSGRGRGEPERPLGERPGRPPAPRQVGQLRGG